MSAYTDALKAERKNSIDLQEYRFFARYGGKSPTAEQIIADANKAKKTLDRFTYQRIINKAKSLPAPRPAVTRPAPPPNGSAYFQTPGTPAAATAGKAPVDPSTWLVIAILVGYAVLRR